MFKKGTKLYSVFYGKCPRCHYGDFFKYNFTFNPSKITVIHKNCGHCNLKYMLEPSFYYGAMYVNYGLTVAISVLTFLISKVLFDASLLQSFGVIFLTLVLTAPINLRFSRILWLNMFVSFDPKFQKENLTKNK